MRCSGCGSNIPFIGDACPFCLRDKSSDQSVTMATGIGVVVGGFIGNLISGFGGMIVGSLTLGFIAAVIAAMMAGKNHSARKPPRVRVEPAAPVKQSQSRPAPVGIAAAADSVEDRLRRLDRLKAEGMLSDVEHSAQRRAIIAAL